MTIPEFQWAHSSGCCLANVGDVTPGRKSRAALGPGPVSPWKDLHNILGILQILNPLPLGEVNG